MVLKPMNKVNQDNLDSNISTKLMQEFDIVNLKILIEELKHFEIYIPKLTIRPV